uniref:Saccharopine dehydrogenase NADP binding domain-containing protein n=1 Tax=Plectus sambesii TaxID=2011161 RepID=A0A914UP68_9BILA
MAQKREFDIIVFGATGYTGHYVVETLAKSEEAAKYRWAVAGRSILKLRKTLDDVGLLIGRNLRTMTAIKADVEDEASLNAMAKRTRLVINTVGPFIQYGEAVVRCCVENGTAHLDTSGEQYYIERMQLKYHTRAGETGAFIVGGSSFASVPVDIGVDLMKSKFDGRLAQIENILRIKPGSQGYRFNVGTFSSMIHMMANMLLYRKQRHALMPDFDTLPAQPFVSSRKLPLYKQKQLNCWCLLSNEGDKQVVDRTQYSEHRRNGDLPVLYEQSIGFKSLLVPLGLVFWAIGVFILSQVGVTRRFMETFPRLCSFGMFSASGPTRQQAAEARFTHWFFGRGWGKADASNPTGPPNKKIIMRCDGP